MTLEVPHGVVIVTGAAATGKTTLARKLAKSAGRKRAAIISGKEIFERCRDPNRDNWETQFCWRLACVQEIFAAIESGRSVVFELQFPKDERLNDLLMSLHVRDCALPISLVKVTVTEAEQQRYARHCKGVGNQEISTSNRRFSEILNTNYSESCGLARECIFDHHMISGVVFAA